MSRDVAVGGGDGQVCRPPPLQVVEGFEGQGKVAASGRSSRTAASEKEEEALDGLPEAWAPLTQTCQRAGEGQGLGPIRTVPVDEDCEEDVPSGISPECGDDEGAFPVVYLGSFWLKLRGTERSTVILSSCWSRMRNRGSTLKRSVSSLCTHCCALTTC